MAIAFANGHVNYFAAIAAADCMQYILHAVYTILCCSWAAAAGGLFCKLIFLYGILLWPQGSFLVSFGARDVYCVKFTFNFTGASVVHRCRFAGFEAKIGYVHVTPRR